MIVITEATRNNFYGILIHRFIDMYGRKFTREQHVKLVELMVEVLTIETVPLAIVVDVSELLQVLLK